MEAKRRKTSQEDDEKSGEVPTSSSRPRKRREIKEASSITMAQMKLEDPETLRRSFVTLKLALSSAASVNQFVLNQPEVFKTIVLTFVTLSKKLGTQEFKEAEILQSCMSVLANCCNLSLMACLEMKQTFVQLPSVTVRLLENTQLPVSSKATLCRLIANLCAHKESAHWISQNALLIDRVCLLLESDHESIVKQSIRVVKNLVSTNFTRVVMLSNACYHLGKILGISPLRPEIISILEKLLRRHKKDVDRQLASSACTDQLINMFFEIGADLKELSVGQKLVIDLCDSPCVQVREQLENAGIIERLITTQHIGRNKLLGLFSQTAWGRARLRISGALDLLVEEFYNSQSFDERYDLAVSFRHFAHDMEGIAYLSANKTFINTVVRDVYAHLEKHRRVCQPKVDIQFIEKLSAKLEYLSQEKDKRTRDLETQRLYKDFFPMWAYETAPNSPIRSNTSPNPYGTYSPVYGLSSPMASSSIGSSSPPQSSGFGHGTAISLCGSDVDVDDQPDEPIVKENDKKQEKTIVESLLYVLTRQSHNEANLVHLIREDVVDCVITYLRHGQNLDYWPSRVLLQMAKSRGCLEQLIDMEFHTRVLTGLCAVPCRMLKYSQKCDHCEGCSERGREVLREFASHVDSKFGHSFLLIRLRKDEFLTRTKAAIAIVALIRDHFRSAWSLSASQQSALDVLFDSLHEMLKSEEGFEQNATIQTYKNGPSLCSQIIGAMSSLITGQRIRQLCENDLWYLKPNDGHGVCEIKKSPESEEMLSFVDCDGEEIGKAKMEAACASSRYFEGMYRGEFAEKTSQKRVFEVDTVAEGCSKEEYRAFLHLLSGCTSSCTAVHDANAAAALLQLSDRYLCPDISQKLCASDGPMRTYISGETLPLLFPVALSTNSHEGLLDTTFLVLVRYTQHEEVTESLRTICGKPYMVDTFLTNFRRFLDR